MALEAPGSQERQLRYFTYILFSESLQKYYVGSTNNLEDRLARHNKGEGKYTSKGTPWLLVWRCDFENRNEAFSLEQKIKKRGIKRYLDSIIFDK